MTTARQIVHSAFCSAGGMGAAVVFSFILLVSLPLYASSDSLLVFAGAASKPPTEEAAGIFSRMRGVEVNITFGGSGFVLSQMKLARRGDVYFPGSSDFMEKARQGKLVFPETEEIIAYLVPAINVQKGNPREVRSLRDLLRPGLRLAIADPERVCVGTYGVEVLEKNLTPEERRQFRKNLVTTVESCEKTANVIALKSVDAVLGWEVFRHWDPVRIETIFLKPEEVPRIGYLPAAVSAFTRNRRLAGDFVQFLASPDSKSVFKKHGYLMTLGEARAYTLSNTPVGGEYSLPAAWRR